MLRLIIDGDNRRPANGEENVCFTTIGEAIRPVVVSRFSAFLVLEVASLKIVFVGVVHLAEPQDAGTVIGLGIKCGGKILFVWPLGTIALH